MSLQQQFRDAVAQWESLGDDRLAGAMSRYLEQMQEAPPTTESIACFAEAVKHLVGHADPDVRTAAQGVVGFARSHGVVVEASEPPAPTRSSLFLGLLGSYPELPDVEELWEMADFGADIDFQVFDVATWAAQQLTEGNAMRMDLQAAEDAREAWARTVLRALPLALPPSKPAVLLATGMSTGASVTDLCHCVDAAFALGEVDPKAHGLRCGLHLLREAEPGGRFDTEPQTWMPVALNAVFLATDETDRAAVEPSLRDVVRRVLAQG